AAGRPRAAGRRVRHRHRHHRAGQPQPRDGGERLEEASPRDHALRIEVEELLTLAVYRDRRWLRSSDCVLSRRYSMILRIDRLQTELPPPSDPDPVGASAVQELLGGKFGEMSTFMNYTYQSFNFRNRQGARPFYDLLASIAAEEFGHIELVSAAINTMLTGAADGTPGKAGVLKGVKDT